MNAESFLPVLQQKTTGIVAQRWISTRHLDVPAIIATGCVESSTAEPGTSGWRTPDEINQYRETAGRRLLHPLGPHARLGSEQIAARYSGIQRAVAVSTLVYMSRTGVRTCAAQGRAQRRLLQYALLAVSIVR